MADNNPGFLDRIGVGSGDERALLDAQQRKQGNRFAQQQRSLGEQAAPLLGGLVSGAAGLITGNQGGRGFGAFKENFKQGLTDTDDQNVASAAGIDVATLRRRRALRTKLAAANIPNDGSIESRLKIAQFAAQAAGQLGATSEQFAALAEIAAIKKEKTEFDRLQAQTSTAKSKALEDAAPDIYLAGDTVSRTAQLVNDFTDPQTGESRGNGAVFINGQGQSVFVPNGQFSLTAPDDPNAGDTTPAGLAKRLRNIQTPTEGAKLRTMITTGVGALRQFRRILDATVDLSEKGGIGQVLSTAGKFIVFADNTERNVQAIVGPALGIFSNYNGKKTKASDVRKDLMNRSEDVNETFWLGDNGQHILSPELRQASAEAQQFRARIMELAYFAARMAEPSNRGLSDNDIKNALQRIAGGTSNPQVMMRRFAEMTFDAAGGIEDSIDVLRGSFRDVDNKTFDDFIGGDALIRYRGGLEDIQKDFSFTVDSDGRATFGKQLDADVNPGTGVPGLPTSKGNTQQTQFTEQDDNDFLESF